MRLPAYCYGTAIAAYQSNQLLLRRLGIVLALCLLLVGTITQFIQTAQALPGDIAWQKTGKQDILAINWVGHRLLPRLMAPSLPLRQ